MVTGLHAKGELLFVSSHLLPLALEAVTGSFDSLREVQGSDSHGLSLLAPFLG